MEIATAVVFVFVLAIMLMVIALPLMIISRITRMLKNSYAKLFKPRPRKA